MLNPITYSERVVGDFLRYQLTTYPLADERLHAQMRRLLNLEHTRATPLLKGPFISLSRAFRRGSTLDALVAEGLLHPHVRVLAEHPNVYGHQESAIRAIASGRTTLVSTGTGSGKTEAFLYPIISHCLRLRDEGAPPGISAVLVYPMNALAEDQLGRLRQLLVGTGVTFGMYIGKTPRRASDVVGVRLSEGASRADYDAAVARLQATGQHLAVYPPEERPSREELQAAGAQPRILLTNVKQLELLLTRQHDVELFENARLDFLVFDEAHAFSGALGGETACLVRRLRSFCGKQPEQTACVATSATIADPERGRESGRDFAARFFGVEAEGVALVGEEYEADLWAAQRTASSALAGDPKVQLQTVLEAVAGVEHEPPSKEALQLLKGVFQTMTGTGIDVGQWQAQLYDRLAANEVVYQIADALHVPRALGELVKELSRRLGRPVPDEEVVAWLALGAASRRDGRPLLRPVIHGFVRGVEGAVVTFPEGNEPQLWLSREEASADHPPSSRRGRAVEDVESDRFVRLDVMTCTTCGQHYFTHSVADFDFTGKVPGGGEAVEDRFLWRPLEEKAGGRRVVLLDRLICDQDDDGDETADEDPRNTSSVYLCRHCGALHPAARERCDGCGAPGPLVALLAVAQKEERPGYLTTCVSCRAFGRSRPGGYREPARPVRAQAVSDVHVLAQSMIHHAERQRLLVFADNRQDAAFQAGWMQDHARRFRLRSLMYERILASPVSVGDLAGHLDDLLDRDDDLSRALVPEVWRVERKETAGVRHAHERRRFLRAQVLREVVTGSRQRIGLEPWGRMLVRYAGLTVDCAFFARWATRIGCEPQELVDGVATLLDLQRRDRVLWDADGHMFSRYWHDSDFEIARGYFPSFPGGPRGIKLRRGASDVPGRVKQFLSVRGVTGARQAALRWGVAAADLEAFFTELWALLTDELRLLAPVTLTGGRDRPLPGCVGATQLDADLLTLAAHRGLFRCSTCRRTNLRPTPKMACPGRNCAGTLASVDESDDDYDLMVLDRRFEMVRPREHSAQVPPEDREVLERAFKGQSQLVNTLVCTPTLEMGVDIGSLDSVLMRNVPPLPANYWQRAGRAGRRHRMAVNVTYARGTGHDRAYFKDPLKLLRGPITPPRFNLKNEPMVRKHVHATVLTALHRLASGRLSGPQQGQMPLEQSVQDEIDRVLAEVVPQTIKTYLFDAANNVRAVPFDLAPLGALVAKHEAYVQSSVAEVFARGWPLADRALVEPAALARYVSEMTQSLATVIRRLETRLRWALEQLRRLDNVRQRKGTLDPEEDALRTRCDRLVKRLKGIQKRTRSEAEGYDDTYSYAVLAAEGFLPGYGLDNGTVVGFHQATRYGVGARDWEIRRALPMALREYVPGNLIYANGHRFVPRFFHLQPVEPTLFQVDTENGAVSELGAGDGAPAGLGAAAVAAVPICDVDLPHQSHITDEEDYRFQLPVTVYGYELRRHGGGKVFTWGERTVTARSSVHFRLVNVGAAKKVIDGALGFPVCLVCGQSRSPFASTAELQKFSEEHQLRCGRAVGSVGFYADVVADAIAIQGCETLTEAYSVAEALRQGAAEVLEIEESDLQILVIGRAGDSQHDVLLYDPMPGGSGLLDQLTGRWGEVVRQALELMEGCPSQCDSACVDCLLGYRNSFYHRHLDRHEAAERLRARTGLLTPSHDLPPMLPAHVGDAQPTNAPESMLRHLLEQAGFQNGIPQHPVDLGRPLGTTTPDFFFETSSDSTEGVCIYLDGMSADLHGDPAIQRRDRQIREQLRADGYEVIEITVTQLADRESMVRHFRRLGRVLLGKERSAAIGEDTSWFEAAKVAHSSERPPPPLPTDIDDWEAVLMVLDERWQPFARALRDAGIPAPDDAHWDIPKGGRVSAERAILVWTRLTPFVAVVEQGPADSDGPGRFVCTGPSPDAKEVAGRLRQLLEGGGA